MEKILRYKLADYLNLDETGVTPAYAYMNKGINTLDEDSTPQLDSKTYVGDKSETTSVKGYKVKFPFDTDLIKDEAVTMSLYKVCHDQLVGSDAERDFVRVDLYDPIPNTTNKYKARKFRVSVESNGAKGAGGETVVCSGNLNGIGDFIAGWFDTTTKTFTEGTYTETLGVLTVVSIAGTTTGTTKATVTPVLASGNSYMYKTSATVTAPTLNDDATTGYTVWNGTSDITAVTSNQILIVEVNDQYLIKKAGIQTVVSKA